MLPSIILFILNITFGNRWGTTVGKNIYKLVASNRELANSFEVRRQVFIEEQGIPKNLEFDGNDGGALHIVVKEGENFIGTARVLILAGNQAKLERMAVLKPFRRRGIGRRILFFFERRIEE